MYYLLLNKSTRIHPFKPYSATLTVNKDILLLLVSWYWGSFLITKFGYLILCLLKSCYFLMHVSAKCNSKFPNYHFSSTTYSVYFVLTDCSRTLRQFQNVSEYPSWWSPLPSKERENQTHVVDIFREHFDKYVLLLFLCMPTYHLLNGK